MHWTYTACDDGCDLEQGDILLPTRDLKKVLDEVHPHFNNDKYLAFAVTTQACDLVRRGSRPPKARYISICVVRPLRPIIPKLFAEVVRPLAPGLFRKSARAQVRDFLNRVFDQNEQALGLFYFHTDSDVEIGEPSVGMLRVTVAMRVDHYDTLVQSRSGRLSPEYRAKFGWLLGNLYSRAAAPDWADHPNGKKTIKALVDTHVKENVSGNGPFWVGDDLADAGKAAGIIFDDKGWDHLRVELEAHRPKERIELLVEAVVAEAEKIGGLDEGQLRKLSNRLRNNSTLRKLTREQV